MLIVVVISVKVQLFPRFGTVFLMLTCVSLLFSLFGFMAAMMLFGPGFADSDSKQSVRDTLNPTQLLLNKTEADAAVGASNDGDGLEMVTQTPSSAQIVL